MRTFLRGKHVVAHSLRTVVVTWLDTSSLSKSLQSDFDNVSTFCVVESGQKL